MPNDPVTVAADGTVHLPARSVPPPRGVSDTARRYLATPFPIADWPPVSEVAAYRKQIAEVDAGFAAARAQALASLPVEVAVQRMNGVPVYTGVPRRLAAGRRDQAVVFLHGGGMIVFGGELVRGTAAESALQFECRSYAVDYRMPPDHPYPAPVDDCVAAYRAIIERHEPRNVIVAGSSAGGNLAAALALRLRDAGLPAPAALVLLTPEVDLTESGDTFQTMAGLDNVLKHSLMQVNLLYAGGHDLKDPYLSPLFADFTRGFPPSLIQTGTRDLFLSNAVRLHRALRRAGIETELHVWEGMPHGGFGGNAPEDTEVTAEIRQFVAKHWGRTGMSEGSRS